MTETKKGKLKLYLGYAAGVGKTYKMLEEARFLKTQGVDLVVGYFEPHGRRDTIALTHGLEIIPRKKISYRGSEFEEMDADAILARRPELCLVDEFAHTNVPGSARTRRWEDIEIIRDAGIDVNTTMNIQHLESLNDQVWGISGIRVRETIPDWAVQQADEVVVIDLPPRALLNRLERGVIYGQEKIELALKNFFRESTLAALRELALRETAHEIETRAIHGEYGAAVQAAGSPGIRHRILIHVTENPESAMIIRRARRVGDFIGAECFAVTVQPAGNLEKLPEGVRETLERHLNFARNMRIETRILEGTDTARTLIEFARRNQITQLFLARPRRPSWPPRKNDRLLPRIVRLAKDMQIVIVSERETPRITG
ncbi:MAG TPA: histidine kinase [Acidobacteriota bacterium]|nr:histidine kinase [Acidobacteriota bacterium]